MTKKSSASSQPGKPRKKSKPSITATSAKNKSARSRTAKKTIKPIDLSDIPELDFEALGAPLIGRFYKPIKKQISIRIDADILDWFQHASNKYQSLINQACREYMISHRKK
jgi:uncharacterized protein (DUF4415 family)